MQYYHYKTGGTENRAWYVSCGRVRAKRNHRLCGTRCCYYIRQTGITSLKQHKNTFMGIPFQSLSLLLLPGRCALRVHLLRIRFHRVYIAHACPTYLSNSNSVENDICRLYARLWRSTLAVTPHRVVECFLFISISIRKLRLKITITNKSPPNIIPLDVYKIDGRMFALLWNGCRRFLIWY